MYMRENGAGHFPLGLAGEETPKGAVLCFILGLSKNIALFLTIASTTLGAVVFPIHTDLSQGSQFWLHRWASVSVNLLK